MNEELKSVNLHQAGSRPNRSAADNLFLLRGCIDHQKYKGKALYLTAYDFEQAFDSLWLQDCIWSLKKLGIKSDILKLVYNLNKVAKMKIKTPYGLTDMSIAEDIVEQGTVLGPILCSSSTAEYCETNRGVAVGTAQVSSLMFVDDTFDVSGSRKDAIESHENAKTFGKRKKLTYSKNKCKTMVVNANKEDKSPVLYIDEVKLEEVSKITYLGDVFNDRGNNIDLIDDRVKRGLSALVRIEAVVRETCLGIHTVNVHLLLYQSLFLSCVLFNSQAWSNLLKERDVKPLQCLQMKLLKKILDVPKSTANSFTCLEFGVLPIKYEIHKNQLMFLHHILNLHAEDPVRVMLHNMKLLSGEKNWWKGVESLLKKYGVNEDDATKSKMVFRTIVGKSIGQVAFKELTDECKSKNKTKYLRYKELKRKEYLTYLYPSQAKTIFQCRSKTLDIKDHRSYKYDDRVCRGCKIMEEDLNHVVNCGYSQNIDVSIVDNVDDNNDLTKLKLIAISNRIETFINKYSDSVYD